MIVNRAFTYPDTRIAKRFVPLDTHVPTVRNLSELCLKEIERADRFFDGAIDEARVWNRTLSLTELIANRDLELNGDEPGLVAYFKLNEGTGQIAADSASHANDAVLGLTLNPKTFDPSWFSSGP